MENSPRLSPLKIAYILKMRSHLVIRFFLLKDSDSLKIVVMIEDLKSTVRAMSVVANQQLVIRKIYLFINFG